MPQNDAATLSVATAKFFVATVGTAYGAESGWTEIGHTSIDNVIGVNSEGGDVTTLGTLQKKQLRTSREDTIDTFRIDLQQWDLASLKLYFGTNLTVVETDLQGVPSKPVPTTTAWKMVAQDGTNEFGIYAPKAEIFRGDTFSLSNEEALSSLPVDVRPLQYNENVWAYALTPLGSAG